MKVYCFHPALMWLVCPSCPPSTAVDRFLRCYSVILAACHCHFIPFPPNACCCRGRKEGGREHEDGKPWSPSRVLGGCCLVAVLHDGGSRAI